MEEIPQNIRMELKAAKDLLESGGKEAAEEAREKLLDLEDANGYAIYHLLLAKAAKELNQEETAIAHLEKSLEFDTENALAVLRVAEHRIKKGDLVGCAELLNHAVNSVSQTGDSKIGCKIAALLIKSERTDEAITLLRQLKNENPNNSEVLNILGLAYRESGDNAAYVSEGLAAIERASLKKSIKQRIGLSKHFINHGEYSKALNVLTPLARVEESDYPNERSKAITHTLLAICYVETDDINSAREHIIEVENQSNIGANYVWSKIQLTEGDLETAYSSAIAIRTLAVKNLDRLSAGSKNELGMLESPGKQALKERSKRVSKSSPEGIEALTNMEINKSVESINIFLAESKKVLLASVPG